jgi:hypothetical protein
MTATAVFPGFYRGAINLWVEDTLTRDYLRKVWQDHPALVFYVGGGIEGVNAVLREAEIAGLNNVFAFVDRDFGTSNRPNWNNPAAGSRRFVSSHHEIENHLLAPDAIAGCSLNTGRRSAADIEARMHQRATELAWSTACRCVIAEAKRNTLQNFPAHPKCPPVTDQATAESYILGLPWWAQLQAFAPSLANANLKAKLLAHHAAVSSWLGSKQWTVEFSGKELFLHVSGWVYANPVPGGSPAANHSDLAKAVGEWQAANNQVPQELSELLTVLKARTGIP